MSGFDVIDYGQEDYVFGNSVVEYMPNTHNSLRQPVFKGLRDDVLPEEVRTESGRSDSGYVSQLEE